VDAQGRPISPVPVRPRRAFDDEEGRVDVHELVAWAALACLVLAIVLAQVPLARRVLTAEPEVDVEALELYQALRRQRLLQHTARLRRILQDDSHQSACRQLGNRMAYNQLLRELAELGESERALLPASGWAPTWNPVVAVAGRGAATAGYAPRVEVLDFGRPQRR
jgi:hypothetical protein